MNRLLYALTARLPCRLINLPSGPYLERYYVARGVYLHRFVSGDSERQLHNHPWSPLSVVLAGGYTEDVVTDLSADGPLFVSCRVRWWNRIPANKFHRITGPRPGTWTLFIHGERIPGKGWGFLRGREFVPHPSASDGWHLTAPLGRDAGRQPL